MWHLNFFGGLRASRPDRTLERFRTQKTAALLALLALRGSRTREEVCALLWPEAAPEAARNSLSAALSALRRDLGDDMVRADRLTVALTPGSFETDVAQFNEAFKTENFARAVELYRGHLLPGFYEDPFPSLEREYQEKAHSAFYARLEELEQNGQSVESLELARRAASLFGDEERWFVAFMRAHYGLGDLDAALRAYEALGRFMRRSGGTASETARALAKAIRRDKEREASTPAEPLPIRKDAEISLSPESSVPVTPRPVLEEATAPEVEAPRNNLPTQWTRFFGREAERATLADWLRQGQRLVTLSGAGGSGKTRLALETLRELAPNWEGDLVYVPLASLEDAEHILPATRDALGLTGTPDLSPLEQIERSLRGRRAMLYLDNFEQLVEGGAARLQTLRERLPHTTFLVTSRVLLQLPGEREFPVSPLPTPLRHTSAQEVRQCASAALFCDRAGIALDDSNAEAVGALCRRLDGIPLALELAAARAKVLSPAQILERLQKHPDFLQSRELGIPARHKTLRATIEWSTDLLPPALRQFWTRLSLFHGGWTLDAAEKVASPGICEEWETLDWLTLLRECSLIFIEEREGEPRFRLLQTLREFGREQLQDAATAERAFFDFYLGLAQQAAGAMQGPGQTAWLARLDTEQDNLRAALAYARDCEPERGLLLATALIDFWETRLNLDEGRAWIETFLRATAPPAPTPAKKPAVAPIEPSANTDARVRALSGAGRMASHSIELGESRALVEQGLQEAQRSGDVGNFVYAVAAFTRFAMTTGDERTDLPRARELAEEALRRARQSNDQALLLEALMSLVYLRMTAADLDGVRPLNLEAIALARGLKDEARLSRLLSNLAHLAYHEKKWDEANELLDESTPLARRLNSPWELLEALWTRSNVVREQGHLDIARATILEEWDLCRESPALLWARDMSLLVVGYLKVREGDAASAVRLWGAEERLRENIGFMMPPIIRLDYTRYCDEARRVLGDARFREIWREGRALSPQQAVDAAFAEQGGELAARARALSGAGRMAWYASDLKDAQSKLQQGLEAARQSGDSSVLINATRSSALASTAFGDALQARDLGREGVRLAREAGDAALLLKSLMDLGFAEINVSDFQACEIACLEAIALARREGDERALAMTLDTLAIAYNYQHRYAEANVLLAEGEALARRLGALWELIVALSLRGHIASILEQHDEASAAFREVLPLARASQSNSWNLVNILLSVAYAFARRGDARGCARILGGCEAFAEKIDYQLMPFLLADYEHFRDESRRVLGEAAFKSEWRAGRTLSLDEIIDFALRENGETAAEGLATRAHALSAASRLAWYDGDFEASRLRVREALNAARQARDTSSFVHAVTAFVRLSTVGGDVEGDIAQGRQLAEEAIRLSRAAGDEALLAEALIAFSYAAMVVYQLEGLQGVLEEAIALSRKLGDDIQLTTALTSLGTLFYYQEQFAPARTFVEEGTAIARRLHSPFLLFASLWCGSNIAREQDDFETAQDEVVEILELCRDANFRWSVSNALSTASYLLIRRGDVVGGVQAMGATLALGEQINYKLVPSLRVDFDRYRTIAHDILGAEAFAAAWQAGEALTVADAIDFVIERLSAKTTKTPDPTIAARARALSGAGRLAWYASDMERADSLLRQGLEAAREIGDTEGVLYAASGLTRTTAVLREDSDARDLSRHSVELARESGNTALLIKALLDQAFAEVVSGHLDEGLKLGSEAARLAEQTGDEATLPLALNIEAIVFSHTGRARESLESLRRSEEITRRLGSAWDLQIALANKGYSLSILGEHQRAQEAFTEGLTLGRASFSEAWTTANNWFGVACIFLRRGDVRGGAQLLGASEAMRQRIGYEVMPLIRPDYDWAMNFARQTLGEKGLAEAMHAGAQMTPDEVFDFATRPFVPAPAPANVLSQEAVAARSRALSGAGRLAWHDSDMEASRALVEEGLEAALRSGDTANFVHAVAAFVRLAVSSNDVEGVIARAKVLSEQAVERSRLTNDKILLLNALTSLAYATCIVSQFAESFAASAEAVALARQLGDELGLVRVLTNQVALYYYQNRPTQARPILEECIEICRRLNSPWDTIAALWIASGVLRLQGQLEESARAIAEVLELCHHNASYRWGVTNVLMMTSYLFVERGEPRTAVLLMAASGALSEALSYYPPPAHAPEREQYLAKTRQLLGEAAFSQAWEQGKSLLPDAAIELALTGLRSPAPTDETLAARSRALSGAGRLAWHDSDLDESRALIHEGLEAARKSGDVASFVYAVAAYVRFAMSTGDVEGAMTQARLLSEEAVTQSRRAGNKPLLLDSLISLGYSHSIVANFREAYAVNEEAIALARELGDETSLVRVLNNQAAVYFHQGLYAPARTLIEESVPLCRRLNSSWDSMAALWTLSGISREQGDLELAATSIAEVLQICRKSSIGWAFSNVLITASYLFVERGDLNNAVCLMSAAHAIGEMLGYHLVPILLPEAERYKAKARNLMTEATFTQAWEKGRTLSIESATRMALGE